MGKNVTLIEGNPICRNPVPLHSVGQVMIGRSTANLYAFCDQALVNGCDRSDIAQGLKPVN